MRPFPNPEVAAAFDAFPPKSRRKLLALRELVLDVAAATPGVGEIEETLKWGQPAYLTTQSGSGSTVRLGASKAEPEGFALFFHCQTTLVETFRDMFPEELSFEGNRAIVFGSGAAIPKKALSTCVAAALTYHRDKKVRGRKRRKAG